MNKLEWTSLVIQASEMILTDKATSARLRRAATLNDIGLDPAYVRFRGVAGILEHSMRFKAQAIVLGVLAQRRIGDLSQSEIEAFGEQPHVNHPARQMALGERPKVSSIRFRRLLYPVANEPENDFYTQLRRMLPLIRDCNPVSLAYGAGSWFSPVADYVRREWATEYYENVNLRTEKN